MYYAGDPIPRNPTGNLARPPKDPAWPIINKFPTLLIQINTTVFQAFCHLYTVLPDFWKYWAIYLRIRQRCNHSKLEIVKPGTLPQNSEASGAPMINLDSEGKKRFVIVDRVPIQKCAIAPRLAAVKKRHELLEDNDNEDERVQEEAALENAETRMGAAIQKVIDCPKTERKL